VNPYWIKQYQNAKYRMIDQPKKNYIHVKVFSLMDFSKFLKGEQGETETNNWFKTQPQIPLSSHVLIGKGHGSKTIN
jgi:hypothetical protein